MTDKDGSLISENFYWRNGVKDLDYTPLNTLAEAPVTGELISGSASKGTVRILLRNPSQTVSFANRLRLVNKETGERVLPILMNDNYITLMPGEEREVTVEASPELLKGGADVLVKEYGKAERTLLSIR